MGFFEGGGAGLRERRLFFFSAGAGDESEQAGTEPSGEISAGES